MGERKGRGAGGVRARVDGPICIVEDGAELGLGGHAWS